MTIDALRVVLGAIAAAVREDPLEITHLLPLLREYAADADGLEDFFDGLGHEEVLAVYAGARALGHALAERRPTHLAELDVPSGTVRIFQGDLEVDGRLTMGGILVVLGNLRARDYWDHADLPLLAVLGDVEVASAIIGGGAAVGGNLEARLMLWGFFHGDSVFVGGRTSTEALFLDDKELVCADVRARVNFGTVSERGTGAELLVPEIRAMLDSEDGLDMEVLTRLVSEGKSLLQPE